jgi:hypothetical protein
VPELYYEFVMLDTNIEHLKHFAKSSIVSHGIEQLARKHTSPKLRDLIECVRYFDMSYWRKPAIKGSDTQITVPSGFGCRINGVMDTMRSSLGFKSFVAGMNRPRLT